MISTFEHENGFEYSFEDACDNCKYGDCGDGDTKHDASQDQH